MSRKRAAGAIRCLVDLSMLESCLCLFLCMAVTQCYGKRRDLVMVVQMDNLRGLLGIKRMDRVPNARIRE